MLRLLLISDMVPPMIPLDAVHTISPTLRTWVALDAENLDRGRRRSNLTMGLGAQWRQIIPTSPLVRTVVGADTSRAGALHREFPEYHHVLGTGENGADLALLDAIETDAFDGSFGCLVIGSGDGIFAPIAARARRAGMVVVVIAPDECLHRDLDWCAHLSLDFPAMPDLPAHLRFAA